VNIRSYQDNYYAILGGGTSQKFDDVRHAYLHYHLDNLVARNITKIQNGSSLLALVANSEGVDRAYTSEFHIMATESLIRAIELRLDRAPEAIAREKIEGYYRTGLLLAPRFYEAVNVYEGGESDFRDFFPKLASAIDVKQEQLRFEQTFHKIPVPQRTAAQAEVPVAEPLPPPNPLRDLLKEGEAAMSSGDLAKARAAFEKVLSDYDRENGAAFYGLALIASRKDDREEARQFFERTVRSTVEPAMKVWAYIYLGRIFDIECNRDRAVSNYQQALKVGDNTRNAQAVAREGVEKPYGGGCR
jgi:tetratricopeptide (TPR) repeat protein